VVQVAITAGSSLSISAGRIALSMNTVTFTPAEPQPPIVPRSDRKEHV
jgi:hypothetical protein